MATNDHAVKATPQRLPHHQHHQGSSTISTSGSSTNGPPSSAASNASLEGGGGGGGCGSDGSKVIDLGSNEQQRHYTTLTSSSASSAPHQSKTEPNIYAAFYGVGGGSSLTPGSFFQILLSSFYSNVNSPNPIRRNGTAMVLVNCHVCDINMVSVGGRPIQVHPRLRYWIAATFRGLILTARGSTWKVVLVLFVQTCETDGLEMLDSYGRTRFQS